MKSKINRNHLLLKGWLAMNLSMSLLPAVSVWQPLPVLAEEQKQDEQENRIRISASAGSVWDGSEPLTIRVEGAEGIAYDDESFVLTKGADKYEIVDSQVVLKEGMTAAEGDEIEIQAAASWYEANELLWNENLETENSLTPSAAGKYCLKHSTVMARHGEKSGTTTHTNVKDGMWSSSIGSTGTLVFWYYDPATEAELDADTLASRSPAFDQMKFGMTINNYPDFIFGVAIPASGDKGPNGSTMTMAQRAAYATNYTVRYGGNWNSTNIERSKGWHKMEAHVTADGTSLKIDGEDVCLKGSETPLVITSLKSITKAGFATNWGDKKEVTEFIEDKHFIDDVYIVKPDVEGPHTYQTTLNIKVRTGEASQDEQDVDQSIAAAEALSWEALKQSAVPDQKTAEALFLARAKAVAAEGVNISIQTISWKAPTAGSAANPEGTDGSITFSFGFARNEVKKDGSSITVAIQAEGWAADSMELNPAEDGAVLTKGEETRMVLDGSADYAIESVDYTTNNENVLVDKDGTLSIKPGYSPKAGETVTVTANVHYYEEEAVHFTDSFEGEKKFTAASNAVNVYTHSGTKSLFGRKAATPQGSTNGYPRADLGSLSDVKVSAWYYDTGNVTSQLKFGFGLNGNTTALGIFYDGVIASYVNNMTKDHYGNRIAGFTYNDYAWGTTDASRSEGWHHFEWLIDSEKGLTEKVDGQIVSTNPAAGKSTTVHDLVKAENLSNVKELNSLVIMDGWNNNAENLGEIADRHFIDGVVVADLDAELQTMEVVSAPVALSDTDYSLTPASLTVNADYPNSQTIRISPYVKEDTDIQSITLDGQEIAPELWSDYIQEAPVNASNYPESLKGYTVELNREVFQSLEEGDHTLVLITKAGSEISVPVHAKANTHTPVTYYLSNSGSDDNDGHSEATPWKSFEKLSTVTFGPGDKILLDAQSSWSHVQFRPEGSGSEGAPVIMSAYNTEGDSSRRPVLNGDGTIADLNDHSYVAFDAWRAFYPSGTIELFNVENWEIRDVEITNYAQEMQKGATGRNGIAVIYDYMEVQGLTSVPSSNADREKAFYNAGKLQHIVIDNCYIHDVTGYHPANGAQGRGGKMSGGINVYGPYDDVAITNNIVMYCDVEGIRNDVLAWMGDTRTQFPAYMKDIVVSNNYIAGVPGDGVVISSADKPVIENNYLTDAGYSYFAKTKTNNVSGVTWNASNLASCRAVEEKTGATVKDMGNRQSPITMGATNFAGLWFIGTKDAAAQYNEASNNVWTCNDGEAFDADMYCSGTIFQYNYTYRNNGGLALFMPTMDEGTVVRYNVSVEDGQSLGIAESQNGLFHYIGTPEAIHNNVFILSDSLNTIFGGGSNTAWFYNNIVAAPNGLSTTGTYNGFHINGSSDGNVQNPKLSGAMNNNLFYPAGIIESVVEGSSVTKENNVVLNTREELNTVFADLDAFLEAQPVKALNGRSAMSGDPVEELEYGKGAGTAFSAEAGRSIQTPTGGFDLSVFQGVRLAENSPAIGAGTAEMRDYAYKAQNDAAWPLEKDFFENEIDPAKPVDIGVHQKSSEKQTTPDPDPETEGWRNLLKMAVEEAERLKAETDWTHVHPSVVSFFNESLDHAKELLDNASASKDELQEAWSDLTKAIQMIGFTADKSELEALVKEAEAIDLETIVDGEAKDVFIEALANAKAVLDDPDALDETSIIPAVNALREAMSRLETKPVETLDKSMLELLLETAADARNQAEKYSAASHAAFAEYYDQAVQTRESAQTQEEIDAAVTGLHQLWLNLRLLADEDLIADLVDTLSVLQSYEACAFSLGLGDEFSLLVTEAEDYLAAEEKEQAAGLNLLGKMESMINDLKDSEEENQKPETPQIKPDQKPSDSAPEKNEPAAKKPEAEKSSSVNKSVKTAAFVGAEGFIAVGMSALAALGLLKARRKSRKDR